MERADHPEHGLAYSYDHHYKETAHLQMNCPAGGEWSVAVDISRFNHWMETYASRFYLHNI